MEYSLCWYGPLTISKGSAMQVPGKGKVDICLLWTIGCSSVLFASVGKTQ